LKAAPVTAPASESETTHEIDSMGGWPSSERRIQMRGTILIAIVILFLLGALPAWPHSRSWGYGPSGGLGLIVVVLVVLLLMGRL